MQTSKMNGEADTTLIIRAMREEMYVAQLAWAGYAAAVDARALHIPRSAPRSAIRKEDALLVLRNNLARIESNEELVAAGTLNIMRALTEIAERNIPWELLPWEEVEDVGATVGLEVCDRFVRVSSASCAFKALADTYQLLAIYKALVAYVAISV
jgi:hypothetical protein